MTHLCWKNSSDRDRRGSRIYSSGSLLCLDLLAKKSEKWEAFRNLMERQGRGECIWTLSDHLFNHLAKQNDLKDS